MFTLKNFKRATHLYAFLIFTAISIYITFPLVFHIGDIVKGFGDELVIAWIQSWVIHALTTNPFSLFEANIYYPYHNSLAFSDLFLTSSILSLIPLKIIGQPIVTVNFTLISSLVLLEFFTYLLIYYLTKDFLLSILGGMLIIFSPVTLDKVVHLQALAIQWVLLSILFFIIFIKTYKTRYLILSLTFFIFQTYNSFLPGYFIIFSYITICIYLWFYKRIDVTKIVSRKNVLIVFIFFLFLIPVVIPYYKVSWEFNYTRDIRETIHFALQPEDLFYPNQYTRIHEPLSKLTTTKNLPKNANFKPGYLGLAFSLLSILTIIYFIISFKKEKILFKSFNSIALFGLLLSFGPALHLGRQTIHHPFPIILPYTLFYYILPGFTGFRNSARWETLFVLGMAIAICLFLFTVFRKLSILKRNLLYILFTAIVIFEYNFPMHFRSIPLIKDFPKVYSWLNTTSKDSKIIEMPIYNWDMQPYVNNEIMRQYYSTIHFRKMVNGYSGFSPPPWQNFVVDTLMNFPSEKTIRSLRNLKIDYILVHKDEYDLLHDDRFMINGAKIKRGNEIVNMLFKNSSLRLVRKIQDVYVFSFK